MIVAVMYASSLVALYISYENINAKNADEIYWGLNLSHMLSIIYVSLNKELNSLNAKEVIGHA